MRLTDHKIQALKPDPSKRLTIADDECPGLYVRLTTMGSRSFACVARDPTGRQVWVTLGRADLLPLDEARDQARSILRRVKAGLPPTEAPAATFHAIASEWLARHVDAKGLRTAPEIRRILGRHLRPVLGSQPLTTIRRADITALLDRIEDTSGARTADTVLAVLRAIFRWHEARDDTFRSPLAGRMRRQAVVRRDRVLTDSELRAVWAAATGPFGDLVKLALLTGQRRAQLAGMRWQDLHDGVWHIPAQERAKGTGDVLVLPPLALAILDSRPHDDERVFAGFNSWSKAKRRLDAASGVSGWVFHDLRRSCRSLLSRCGVRPEVAERVLGHVQPGVAGIYDRHAYVAEKGAALGKLADLIAEILAGAQ